MLAAAAVCPHPPLLVPSLAGDAADETAGLREHCLAAVRELVTAGDDDALDVVVVGSGPTPGTAAPDATGSLAGYGIDLTVSLARTGSTADPSLPLSVTIGIWLLREAGYDGPARARVVTENATPAECAGLGARIAAFPTSTALLVMGDGTARRDQKAPGYFDPRAAPFDAAVATALAEADVAALAKVDPGEARELLAAGRAPWQVLAGAVEADGRRWTGRLRTAEAPYGVGYLVASWNPA